jgi:hypothetical protein
VFDERSDARGMRYQGLKVHGSYLVEGTLYYLAWSFGHLPLQEKNAEAISAVALRIVRVNQIEDKVKYIVSDTTPVMPVISRSALIQYWP